MLPEKLPLNDDILVHFGIKGMKWGVRSSSNTPDASGVTRKQARSTVKSQNRSLRRELEDFHDLPAAKRDATIHLARSNLKSAQRDYEDTRREIKANRISTGKNASRVALNRIGNERISVRRKAETMTEHEKMIKAFQDLGRLAFQEFNAASTRRRAEAASARARPYTPQQPYRTRSERVG